MTNSVNTNNGALVALQSLNRTNSDLERVQKRVTTGYRVNDAVDDGAIFAIAQSVRADIGSIDAVNSQLTVAQGAITVFMTAATNISNSMGKAREVLVKLANANLTSDQRSKYRADFDALKAEIDNFVANSRFNGSNFLSGSTTSINVIANADGTQYTMTGNAFTAAAAFATAGTATAASALLTGDFKSAEARIGTVLNGLGANSRRLKAQVEFNKAFQDALTTSLGAIVDADLAKESANLQALQIKQQLGAQTLGIANQAPQILGSLFR